LPACQLFVASKQTHCEAMRQIACAVFTQQTQLTFMQIVMQMSYATCFQKS